MSHTPGTDQQARLFAAADELLQSCRALTTRQFAGHNGTCICCRQSQSRGHAADCALVRTLALVDKLTEY